MLLGHRVAQNLPKFAQIFGVRNSLGVDLINYRIHHGRRKKLLRYALQLTRPGNGGPRLPQLREPFRQFVRLGELIELPNRNSENACGTRPADEVDQPVGHHFLFLGVPLFPLTVDVNPHTQTLILGERAIDDFGGQGSEFRLPLRYQNPGVRPAPLAINDSEFPLERGMWLDQ